MTPQSAKAKGRKLAKYVAERIRSIFGLPDDDVRFTPSGVPGEDIWLSDQARQKFPFATECKNQQSLNIWATWKQAKEHEKKTGHTPLVVFTRNREDVYCSLRFDDLLKILKGE